MINFVLEIRTMCFLPLVMLVMYFTRNTCMQQPLAYIFQTLFQHEVFIRVARHVSHGNTNHDFLNFVQSCKK